MTSLRLLVTDLSGTVIDHGCRAPVRMFQQAFHRVGVSVSTAEVRKPMGQAKLDHIRQLFALPNVQLRWRELHQRLPTEKDAEQVYQSLALDQEALLLEHQEVIKGVVPTIRAVRQLGLRVSGCSGYNRSMVNVLRAPMERQGLRFDHLVASDEVAHGRPAPDMIQHLMKKGGVSDPSLVIKVGDTSVDIEEGLNAKVWSVGVLRSSSELGLSAEDFDALTPLQQAEALHETRRRLVAHNPHYLVNSIEELPSLINEINERLACGERP